MPKVDIYNTEKKKVGDVALSDDIFDAEVREHLFHELVRAQRAAKRSGTAKVKERSEVIGTRAKAWRQKGTGRARQGARQAVHWKGGGVVHGPRPRSYEKKVNKKTRRAALCAALSRRQQEGHLVVLDAFNFEAIKINKVVGILNTFDVSRVLIVDVENTNLERSARNLSTSNYLPVTGLNVLDIFRHDHLMLTQAAVEAIERRLGE
jgi:large subunit ribosomal protein L4